MGKPKISKSPCAFLFANGSAAFLDENGKQMGELQVLCWKGLHIFREKYPEAPVSLQYADPIYPDLLPYILENIIDPRIHE